MSANFVITSSNDSVASVTVDQKRDLEAVCLRFKQLHQMRIQRVQENLATEQQGFLTLLPLIFHLNHPDLPGFIDTQVPAGIPDYGPSETTVDAAKRYAPAFDAAADDVQQFPIYAVFLMGSISSIAFSNTSDMDVWICYQPDLLPAQIARLQRKANAVEAWALTLGLEVHIFLIDHEAFRQGRDTPISTESSGATQHYLLLEEFYRTAVFIAGRIPVWWLVPPERDRDYSVYVESLLQSAIITEQDVIDFGGFEAVPVEEFISATLWHLYKAIASPYKSLLKLMLMECYASEYPEPQWLCLDLKSAVYQGECDIDALDPYLQLYQKIENYMSGSRNIGRLDLIRQSFYIKIMGAADDVSEQALNGQREQLIVSVAEKWQWSDQTYINLIQRQNWNIENAVFINDAILQELNHCYRSISGFASQYMQKQYREHEDIKLIGRKLYTLLDRRPGKIEAITTKSIIYRKEKELSILEVPFASGNFGWGLYHGCHHTIDYITYEPFKKAWSLVEILAWLVINDFFHPQGVIHFSATSMIIPSSDLKLIIEDLRLFLQHGRHKKCTSLDIYKQANQLTSSMLIINLGLLVPEQKKRQVAGSKMSTSVFSYGIERYNFVVSTERISFSSWGEVISHRYDGIEGLFNCLVELVNAHHAIEESQLQVHCYTPVWSDDIVRQVNRLYSELIALLDQSNEEQAPRYIVQGENAYYLFQKQGGQLGYRKIASEVELLVELGAIQKTYSPILLTELILKNYPIPGLVEFNKAHYIQVFYQDKSDEIDVYVLDEKGSLFIQTHQNSEVHHLLAAYSIFLKTLINRGALAQVQGVEYYQIAVDADGMQQCRRVDQNPIPENLYFDLRIAGKELSSGHIIYTVVCNGLEFSTMEHGGQVFQHTADYVISQRKDRKAYPIHITDMDMPLSTLGIQCSEDKQAIHFLQHKKHIEDLFNNQ